MYAKYMPKNLFLQSKLEINVRNILNEQKSKLQQKQQLEHELLEDIKYAIVVFLYLLIF